MLYVCGRKPISRIAVVVVFFFQAEDGIRDLVRSRGLGDVYKRQLHPRASLRQPARQPFCSDPAEDYPARARFTPVIGCLLYTSDAADERSSVDLGGRRIIKKKNQNDLRE